MLTVEALSKAGGFAGKPVKKTVVFRGADGQEVEATVWVRRLSYQSVIGDSKRANNPDDFIALRLASCIVDEDGTPLYSKSDITGYHDDGSPVLDDNGEPRGAFTEAVLDALWKVHDEVNKLGKPASETATDD